jgi:NAD(P)-dependent dehydrogenase (short-subunit alcohol dehydrogenase family)
MALTLDLSGHVAVVTGSTSGIGLGIAKSLAQAGAKVALNSHLDREEDYKIAGFGRGNRQRSDLRPGRYVERRRLCEAGRDGRGQAGNG